MLFSYGNVLVYEDMRARMGRRERERERGKEKSCDLMMMGAMLMMIWMAMMKAAT